MSKRMTVREVEFWKRIEKVVDDVNNRAGPGEPPATIHESVREAMREREEIERIHGVTQDIAKGR